MEEQSPTLIHRILANPVLATALVALGLAISFSPKPSMIASSICLAIAAFLFIWTVAESRTLGAIAKAVAIGLIVLVLAGLGVWLSKGPQEISSLIVITKAPSPPIDCLKQSVPQSTPETHKALPKRNTQPPNIVTEPVETIQSLLIESRITCTLIEGATVQQGDSPFILMRDVSDVLQGPAGVFKLTLGQTLNVWRQEDNRVILTNRYFVPPDSDLIGRSVQVLDSMDKLVIHPAFPGLEKSLDKVTFVEITAKLNGKPSWHFSTPIDNGNPINVQLTLNPQKLKRD